MKRLSIFSVVLCTMACVDAVECQMLLPEAKQKEILGGRWYPQDSRTRIAQAAVRDGYAAIAKKDYENAIREFNRAWRFRPDNPSPYWGAAIAFGMMAEAEKSPAKAMDAIKASLKLFEMAEKHLPNNDVVRENWQLDYAASLYAAGEIALVSDKTVAERYFAEAEKIWLPLLEKRELRNRRDREVYYRTCWHLAKLYRSWGKKELYSKYLQKLPAEVRKNLSE